MLSREALHIIELVMQLKIEQFEEMGLETETLDKIKSAHGEVSKELDLIESSVVLPDDLSKDDLGP